MKFSSPSHWWLQVSLQRPYRIMLSEMSTLLTSRIAALFLFGAALLPTHAPGQAIPATPTLKSTARLVLVDMVVTDTMASRSTI